VILFELTEVNVPCTCKLPVIIAEDLPLLSINMLMALRLAEVVRLPDEVNVEAVEIAPLDRIFPVTLNAVSCPTLVILACAGFSTVLATLA
jgi:hypothetical protein